MGDSFFSNDQLHEEPCRVNTFGENSNIVNKEELAKSGFYFTQIGQKVRCNGCGLEVDTSVIASQDVQALHREKSPNCEYASSQPLIQNRTKKFISYDSLRFEKERLETFIDWPIEWLNPSDLARDGFYYLRTADHCACVFCRGIVGAWEKGDVPRVEHRRHFPLCPFIRGEPVGNIPIAHSSIIHRIVPTPEPRPSLPISMDVCGLKRSMQESYSECDPSQKKADSMLASMGFPKHSGPKRKEYIIQDDRERSFVKWPERVKQTPKELAEAGFFYCGLSDHVRCFHCGNGLRNWEKDDNPWEEHARWYPECSFVQCKKGQEFIDKVRREKPPFLRSQTTTKSTASYKTHKITEEELDHLMELDIIKATLDIGFQTDKVRAALRRKLQQTGLPFFSIETCIEAVLVCMEEETRYALNSNSNAVEREATEHQGAKMEALQASERGGTTATATTTTTTPTATATTPSSSSSSTLSSPAGPSTQPEPMEVESSPASSPDEVLSQADQVIGLAESVLNAAPTSSSSPTPTQSSTPTTTPTATTPAPTTTITTTPSTSVSASQDDVVMKEDKKDLPVKDKTLPGKSNVSQDFAAELERIKDSHMCKVCMDSDIDMVFLPCTHMVSCSNCALALTQCPICRKDIKYAIKPILS